MFASKVSSIVSKATIQLSSCLFSVSISVSYFQVKLSQHFKAQKLCKSIIPAVQIQQKRLKNDLYEPDYLIVSNYEFY